MPKLLGMERKLATVVFVDVQVIIQHGYAPITSNYGTGKDVYVRSR